MYGGLSPARSSMPLKLKPTAETRSGRIPAVRDTAGAGHSGRMAFSVLAHHIGGAPNSLASRLRAVLRRHGGGAWRNHRASRPLHRTAPTAGHQLIHYRPRPQRIAPAARTIASCRYQIGRLSGLYFDNICQTLRQRFERGCVHDKGESQWEIDSRVAEFWSPTLNVISVRQ